MIDKQLVLTSIKRLPGNVSFQQIRSRIEFLAAIKEAEESLERGEGISHQEVKK